ncbi:MAG: hypothetical protein Q4G07_00165 [Oscillospiraceae bacterium]|nr:hypothetical protein [Oscillospiraceae bacterium]
MSAESLKKEEQHRAARRRRRVAIGVVVAFLVVFGLVSLIMTLVHGTMNLFDDTEERKNYEERVKTLVMLDAIPFDSLETADETVLIQACIWDVLFNEDITKFQKDENGAYLVPVVDIDRYAVRLFGPDFKFSHHSFTLSDGYMEFKYNEDSQTYTMPITSMTNNYTPSVVKLQNEDGKKRVTVGYVAPMDIMTNLGSQGKVSEAPAKYYDYIFAPIDGEYYLTAITESETKPEVTASSSQDLPMAGVVGMPDEEDPALDDQKPIETSSSAPEGEQQPEDQGEQPAE